jgi:hypothetical protein
VPSRFAQQLQDVRRKFEGRFPGGTGADTNLGGIPVTITGILFFDRQHRQTGRAVNGVELHPLLDISFDDTVPSPPTPPNGEGLVTQLLANPGFEEGVTGWSGTVDDIGNFRSVRAHWGSNFAWMGGTGTSHTESLYQNVSVPSSARKASLSFWLLTTTDEDTSTQAYDKMYVQIRDSGGAVLTTLKRYSNLDKNNDYAKQTFEVSEYIGRKIQVFIKVTEDTGKATSFMLDDFALTVQYE